MSLNQENKPNFYINTYKRPNEEPYTLYTFELEGEQVSARSIEHLAYLAGQKFGNDVEEHILEAHKQTSISSKEKFMTQVSSIIKKFFRKNP